MGKISYLVSFSSNYNISERVGIKN